MKTHPKKEIRIICELPLSGRMRAHLDRAPISGYTMLPAIGGKGSEGAWSREGLVGDAGQMVVFLIVLDASELEAVLDGSLCRDRQPDRHHHHCGCRGRPPGTLLKERE